MNKNNSSVNKSSYEQQENRLSSQSTEFIQILTKRGILEDSAIQDETIRKAQKKKKHNLYHNTEKLLQNYRNIMWVLECFPENIAEELDRPVKDLGALLSLVSAEIGMENQKLENRLHSIHRTRLVMDRVNDALTILRQKPENGEMLYNVIFETYITPQKLTHDEILYRVNISGRHYYRVRQQAINILSLRLWAATDPAMDSWLEVLTLLESL